MDNKNCYNCEYSCNWEDYQKYGFSVQCTRYPRWIDIYNPYNHWCGEWKIKSEN